MPIMMIGQAIFARYNIIGEGLVKILLDQDDRANKFCPIICVFAQSYDEEVQNQISILT